MTLADAIRKGSEQHPQGYAALWRQADGRLVTCALGAAHVAVFGEPTTSASDRDDYRALQKMFPELTGRRVTFQERSGDLLLIITALNDYYMWTREQIADWVESLEGA